MKVKKAYRYLFGKVIPDDWSCHIGHIGVGDEMIEPTIKSPEISFPEILQGNATEFPVGPDISDDEIESHLDKLSDDIRTRVSFYQETIKSLSGYLILPKNHFGYLFYNDITEEIKNKLRTWLCSLRSGQYVQGYVKLSGKDNSIESYCCLGVAVEACNLNEIDEYILLNTHSELGLRTGLGGFSLPKGFSEVNTSLVDLNDSQLWNFEGIAVFIEERFELEQGYSVWS